MTTLVDIAAIAVFVDHTEQLGEIEQPALQCRGRIDLPIAQLDEERLELRPLGDNEIRWDELASLCCSFHWEENTNSEK